MIRRFVLIALALGLAAPGFANAPAIPIGQTAPISAPSLTEAERASYRQLFQSLAAGDYQSVAMLLDGLPDSALRNYAQAELMLADASRRDVAAVSALISRAPELPQAAALARLVGLNPSLPASRALVRAAGPSKRALTRPTRDAQIFAAKLQPLLKAGDVAGAELLVETAVAAIAPEAMTELRQKVAWAYYQAGDDAAAQRVAALAQAGAGDWAVDAAWVNGLAAWRANAPAVAAEAFDRVASNAGDAETRSAGLFWAARCRTALADTAGATTRLQAAGRLGETFYGMIAGATLGAGDPVIDTSGNLAEVTASVRPNLRAAAALAAIGETVRADQLIRYQARIGAAAEHGQLIAFAASLGLPATQIWLAQNVPAGFSSSVSARFPMPGWSPAQGWRVDAALVFAHALQESELRTDAVSRAGARGLMQLMPTTAQLIARHKGDVVGPLDDPAVSFEYGQTYLEELAAMSDTGGLLPKVIAAYNAGPSNVARWAAGGDDPLLFIESIPFAQTRSYVAIVLRNYWIYQRRNGASTPTLTAIAQGRWPAFPAQTLQPANTGGASTYAPN